MAGKAAIILGHSHLSSIVYQLNDRPGEVYNGDESIQYFVFDTMRMGADFQFSVDSGGGSYILNPKILEMIEDKVPQDRERIYISMFGGNAHNALTLLEHPRPFDFFLPENPGLPMEPGAELITSGFIDAFLMKLAEAYFLNMITLKNAVKEKVFHFESPPPVGSNAFILERLENWFKDEAATSRIAPKFVRYKLWRSHSRLIDKFCQSAGIEFLPTPEESFDEEGFLKQEHGRDSTHADGSFGGILLRNLEHRLGVKYGGWLWL